jgi:hypothetical protein
MLRHERLLQAISLPRIPGNRTHHRGLLQFSLPLGQFKADLNLNLRLHLRGVLLRILKKRLIGILNPILAAIPD